VDDDGVMDAAEAVGPQGDALLRLYDASLGDVYGYLLRRCGSSAVAEDLTSETFLAAVDAVQRDRVPSLTTAWLIGVARNKLVDHWRRAERSQRLLGVIEGAVGEPADDWDQPLDSLIAHEVLTQLAPQHRAALTLRYLDGLPVAEVARHLARTLGATEVLLVRAKRAFRETYDSGHRRPEDGQ
jgi:RNA polymerase sigma-70 factor, ECF subfamily